MARALPNPVSSLEEGQLDTLRDALYQQTETQKWSKNVDINTFRTHSDTKEGFANLSSGFESSNKSWKIAINQGKVLNKNLDPEDENSTYQSIKSGFSDIFSVLAGPVRQLGDNIQRVSSGFDSIFISPMESFSRGASQMGKGFKELGNGIGAMGPVMNTFKTAFYKVTAVVNVLTGAFRIAFSLIKGIIKGFGFFFKGLWNLITNFRETVGKMKDAVSGFFGGIKDRVKGWFGGDKPEDSVKDVLDKDKESSDDIGGGRMIEILESIAGALGAPKEASYLSPEDADKQLQSKFTEIHEEEEAERTALEEKQSKIRHYHETKRAKWLHKKKMSQLKAQGLMYMKKFLTPFLLFIAAMFLLWKTWEEWKPLAGITIALQEAGKKMISKITGIFAGLTKSLATKFPRLFGGLAKTIPPAGVVDDVIKTTGGVADDAVKVTGSVADDAVKAAGGAVDNVAATGGSKLVKGLKVVGRAAGPIAGIAEAGMDWSDQNEKFNRLKIAYENGEKLPMPDGSTRAISDKEFELIERAHVANRAGSVGKGGGSLAAASAAAAVAAPLLATGPLGWLAYGGIVIGSAIAGGMAGDKAATNIFEGGEIDDAQKLVDDFYANLPALPKPTTGLELENLTTDIKDSTATEAAGGNFSPTAIDTSTKVISETIINDSTPMRDEGLEFSNAYIFGHAGAARP